MPGESYNTENQSLTTETKWDSLSQEVPFRGDKKQSLPDRLHVTKLEHLNTLHPETTDYMLNKANLLLQKRHERGEISDEDLKWSTKSIQEDIPKVLADDTTKGTGMGFIDVAHLHADEKALDAIDDIAVSELMNSYRHPDMQLAFGIINLNHLQIAKMSRDHSGKPTYGSDRAKKNELDIFSSLAQQYITHQERVADIDDPDQSFTDFLQSKHQDSQTDLQNVIARGGDTIPMDVYLSTIVLAPDNVQKHISKINNIQKEVAELS